MKSQEKLDLLTNLSQTIRCRLSMDCTESTSAMVVLFSLMARPIFGDSKFVRLRGSEEDNNGNNGSTVEYSRTAAGLALNSDFSSRTQKVRKVSTGRVE